MCIGCLCDRMAGWPSHWLAVRLAELLSGLLADGVTRCMDGAYYYNTLRDSGGLFSCLCGIGWHKRAQKRTQRKLNRSHVPRECGPLLAQNATYSTRCSPRRPRGALWLDLLPSLLPLCLFFPPFFSLAALQTMNHMDLILLYLPAEALLHHPSTLAFLEIPRFQDGGLNHACACDRACVCVAAKQLGRRCFSCICSCRFLFACVFLVISRRHLCLCFTLWLSAFPCFRLWYLS